ALAGVGCMGLRQSRLGNSSDVELWDMPSLKGAQWPPVRRANRDQLANFDDHAGYDRPRPTRRFPRNPENGPCDCGGFHHSRLRFVATLALAALYSRIPKIEARGPGAIAPGAFVGWRPRAPRNPAGL